MNKARRRGDVEQESGREGGFLSVVEFGPPAQQQVDARAEGGVGGQVDGGLSALRLRPHSAQQLFQRRLSSGDLGGCSSFRCDLDNSPGTSPPL